MERASNVTRVSDANSLRALVGATPLKCDWLEIARRASTGLHRRQETINESMSIPNELCANPRSAAP